MLAEWRKGAHMSVSNADYPMGGKAANAFE